MKRELTLSPPTRWLDHDPDVSLSSVITELILTILDIDALNPTSMT